MPKKFIIMPSKLVIVLMILSVILIYGALAPVIFHLETKFPPAILLFLLATGLCLFFSYVSRYEISVGKRLDLKAAFWQKSVEFSEISALTTEVDGGLNHGWVNWPVTSLKATDGKRINLGGDTRLEIQTKHGETYQLVTKNSTQAHAIKTEIERHLTPTK